jgi:hypothetical protein
MSAVNGFFKGHGLEAIALGDLIAKVQKGLAMSHVTVEDTPLRVHMLGSIAVQALRLQLVDSTTRAALKISTAREQVRLLRACTIMVLQYLEE